MTPSIDVSLPTAPVAVRQTTPASASAPVTFQDCLDGVPPAGVPTSPVVTGSQGDAPTDEPRKTAKAVEDPAALAALAALSLPVPLAVAGGAPVVLGSGTADAAAGPMTDVAEGSAPPQPAAALALVTPTIVDPSLAADLAAAVVAGPMTTAAPANDNASGGTSTGDPTAAVAAATTASPTSSVVPAPTASLPTDPGSPEAAGLDLAAAATGGTTAIDAASANETADHTAVPDGTTMPADVNGAPATDQLGGASHSSAAPSGSPSSLGAARPLSLPTASSTLPAASTSAPAAASGAGASRRGNAEATKVDGAAGSPSPAMVGHEPVRSSTASSTPGDSSGRGVASLPHAEPAQDRATGTHTGPMHLDVDLGGEGLGPLRLRATSVAGQLHVSMTATDVRVRSALLDRSTDLKRDMRSAGLDLASFDVNGSAHGRASDGDQSGQPSARHADEASRSAGANPDLATREPTRRVSGQASPSRLDLLL